MVAGDWFDLEMDLNRELLDGYQPDWQLPEGERLGEIGRYRGHPILRGPRDGERRMYAFEPSTWGCLLRAQYENGQELRVDVQAITDERAQEILDADSSFFPDEPDRDSKLRKLQAHVEVIVGARVGFHQPEDSRARRIVGLGVDDIVDSDAVPS